MATIDRLTVDEVGTPQEKTSDYGKYVKATLRFSDGQEGFGTAQTAEGLRRNYPINEAKVYRIELLENRDGSTTKKFAPANAKEIEKYRASQESKVDPPLPDWLTNDHKEKAAPLPEKAADTPLSNDNMKIAALNAAVALAVHDKITVEAIEQETQRFLKLLRI